MKKLLITYFEAFAGRTENLSSKFAQAMQKEGSLDLELSFLHLPVVFGRAAREVLALCQKQDFDYIFCLGEASTRTSIDLERIAINWREARIADNEDNWPRGERIIDTAPDGIFTTVDLPALLASLSKEIGQDLVKVSNTAGTYVCNDLFYTLLEAKLKAEIIFIHLPLQSEEKLLPLAASFLRGLEDYILSSS